MAHDYIKRIIDARVYDVARETPIDRAQLLSERLGCEVLLKREDLQPVFSFKVRGAYNKVSRLAEGERARGVIAASAGNHAQGLALAARHLGVKATIVMPKTTPAIKVNGVRSHGAKVALVGDTYDEASAHARQLVAEKNLVYVHPYDDPDVIAGQGTIGMEILRQCPGPLDAIFVPVGGGGLLAGIAAYIKFARPDIRLIGVEPEDAACLKAALEKGRRVTLPEVGIFADGAAVSQIGKETFRVIRGAVDEVITAGTDEICAAIKDIFEDTRAIAEPAGALALAGLKKYAGRGGFGFGTGKRGRSAAGAGGGAGVEADGGGGKRALLAIVSGANTNFDRLRYISERTEVGEKREAVLSVTIPDRPGSFRAFCAALGKRAITEFNYRYSGGPEAHIFVGMQIAEGEETPATLVKRLQAKGYPVIDLTDNEMAKLHIRHMVGGRAPADLAEEAVFRFEFPERPGALMNFLNHLGQRWNITLFHYRSHGAAYGRVLVGLQIPPADRPALTQALANLHYRYSEETENPAYLRYLG